MTVGLSVVATVPVVERANARISSSEIGSDLPGHPSNSIMRVCGILFDLNRSDGVPPHE